MDHHNQFLPKPIAAVIHMTFLIATFIKMYSIVLHIVFLELSMEPCISLMEVLEQESFDILKLVINGYNLFIYLIPINIIH